MRLSENVAKLVLRLLFEQAGNAGMLREDGFCCDDMRGYLSRINSGGAGPCAHCYVEMVDEHAFRLHRPRTGMLSPIASITLDEPATRRSTKTPQETAAEEELVERLAQKLDTSGATNAQGGA